MPKVKFGKSDKIIQAIAQALRDYEEDHPAAQIELYRQNPASVRIRIVDRDFAKLSLVEREQRVWPYLEKLPETVREDITILLLLAPDETAKSMANLNFEDPLPSQL